MEWRELARFNSILRNNQTNVILDIERSFFQLLADEESADLTACLIRDVDICFSIRAHSSEVQEQEQRQQHGPLMKFHLSIKQYHQLQSVDHLGVPWKTLTTPLQGPAVKCRKVFPVAQARPNLIQLFSSPAIIPPDLLNPTVIQILDFALVTGIADRRAAIAAATSVHVKAVIKVMYVTTEVTTTTTTEVMSPRIRELIHTAGIDVIVDEPAAATPPRPLAMRTMGDLKEQYGLRLGNCTVCLGELVLAGGQEGLLKMPCSHMFHSHCIFVWLKTNNFCPKCRALIPSLLH